MSSQTDSQEKKDLVVELVFSEPQLDLINSTAQANLAYCGKGFGKTHIIGVKTGMYAVKYPHVRGFIGANTYNQLSKSTLVGVFKFWEEKLKLKRDIHYVVNKQPPEHFTVIGPKLENYNHTISFINGKLYFTASLDNYEMLEGMEFAHADLDETKSTKREAVQEVILSRLRQQGLYINKRGEIVTQPGEGFEGFTPLNIYTSPAKELWIAEMFNLPDHYQEILEVIFEPGNYFRKKIKQGNKLVVIASAYWNEDNLAPGYIQRLIDANAHNPDQVNMMVYGSPIGKQGDEYYTQFKRLTHVQDRETPQGVPVHFSFDFNRKPYITMGAYKIWWTEQDQVWDVHKFGEICLPPPKNVTEDLCKRAIELYDHGMSNGLYIYGDSTGKNRRTNSNEHDYDVIFRLFRKYTGARDHADKSMSDRVTKNFSVKHRKDFMNKIFYRSVPIRYTISPKCVNTIKDNEFLKEAPDGGKLKEKDEDGSEKLGHCSDEQEYFFCSAFNQYFKLT